MARSIGVLTSGGDSSGMNAAVRAVVRTAIGLGAEVHAICEGYHGMVHGGDLIRPMRWGDVGGILHLGGTVIGSARSASFRTVEGRRAAAKNLAERGIDGLVVIGGDGSLTGADIFRGEWAEHLRVLAERGELDPAVASRTGPLGLVGLVGSIDNDMFGTDMTIGADTALHRIVEAIDAITSTAASHHRTFVVEVMGRNCGYLALMSGVATGANFILIPESPPAGDWRDELCATVAAGAAAGRRHGIVIVAEGARDDQGQPIAASEVKAVVEQRLGADVRLTILGHVQRGGAPSAFDRYLSTILGYQAARRLLAAEPGAEPVLIGIRHNRVVESPLMGCVARTHEVKGAIGAREYDRAMALRGGSFSEAFANFRTLYRSRPQVPDGAQRCCRVAVLHAGGPAPGMNTAVRAAVRFGLMQGHTMLGVRNGFRGLLGGEIHELGWMSVHGWVSRGGAELGVSRKKLEEADLPLLVERLQEHRIDALLLIGGYTAYQGAALLAKARLADPRLDLPVMCLPASIDNNLPGSEHSIGADTALNSIVADVDKIKQSAVASHRCFIVEVMGRDCGYLALMSGLASGAERVFLPEEGITLDDLRGDVAMLVDSFQHGKRLGLFIRNENADEAYTTDFIARLFDKEGGALFDVRTAILGHVQQGGTPTPYDRIQATRLAASAIRWLDESLASGRRGVVSSGLVGGKVVLSELSEFDAAMEPGAERPREQWWLSLREVAAAMVERTRIPLAPLPGPPP